MQVPYGQLNEVVLDEKKNVSFKFAPSNETKKQLETVQNKFNDFIKYMASFEKIYGRSFEYDFELCEMIFILMVGNHYLSDDILNCFTIDDEYNNGYNEWIYYPKEMIWKVNGETTVPVMLPKGFTTSSGKFKDGLKIFFKERLTNTRLYEPFRKIWVKYIK